jgi:hypothetical protein
MNVYIMQLVEGGRPGGLSRDPCPDMRCSIAGAHTCCLLLLLHLLAMLVQYMEGQAWWQH